MWAMLSYATTSRKFVLSKMPMCIYVNVLSIAIVNHLDVFADDPDYSPSGYQKAAYHQWVLWNHGYLGKANTSVIPSCVVWA